MVGAADGTVDGRAEGYEVGTLVGASISLVIPCTDSELRVVFAIASKN
jgi:hypothetical protein